MKKILAIVLSLILMIGIIPLGTLTASAATSGSCGKNLTWSYNTSAYTLTISGTGAMTDYSSSSSVPWYNYRSSIKNVNIGNSVTSIGGYAFYYCTGLTSVTIPNGVTSIGYDAFSDCTGLTSITVAPGNPIYHSDGNCLINTASKTLIQGCSTSVIPLDGSVTTIGEDAFENCTGLTSVTIPNSVTSIGDDAFSGCTGLTSVTIPDSVTTIGDYAFRGCTGLTSVTIGDSVTTIGAVAFDGCTGLTSVTIPNSVTTIGGAAFYECTGLTSVTIGNSVTTIGSNAFRHCTGLTSVTIPDSVTTIDDYAFDGCTRLTSVTIPDSVTIIGNGAFDGCSKLKDVYYYGTMLQWVKISIGSYNTDLTDAMIYYESYCLVNGHKLGEITVLEDATCTENGSGTAVCARCGETVTVEIPAAHSGIKLRTVAPTCTEDGYDLCRCTVCGTVYSDHAVPALDHDFGEAIITTKPTCTETGIVIQYCSRCDATKTAEVPALKHDYQSVVTPPTCRSEGYTTHTCARCNDSYTDTPVAAIDHNYKATTIPATCTTDGYTAYTCTVCGDTYTVPGASAQGHFIFDGSCVVCGKTERQCEDLKVGTQIRNGETRLILKLSDSVEKIGNYLDVGVVVTIDGIEGTVKLDRVYSGFYNGGTMISAEDLGATYVAIAEIGNISAAQTVTAQGFYTDPDGTVNYGIKRSLK